MGTGNFFIKFLGEHVHTKREFLGSGPESNLSQDLVSERTGHDKRGVTSSTATIPALISSINLRYDKCIPQVNETTLGEKDNVASRSHGVTIDLRFDVDNFLCVGLQPRNIDLNIEMPDAINKESGLETAD